MLTLNHTAQQIAYLTVAIVLDGSADPDLVADELTLKIDHPSLCSWELIHVSD